LTISHVHSGALGGVGFVSFGAIYCLVPWLWERKQLVVAIGGIVEITPLFYLKSAIEKGERVASAHSCGPQDRPIRGLRRRRLARADGRRRSGRRWPRE
jgi:hypothetical protein